MWRATWSTRGCSSISFVTAFHGKVVVARVGSRGDPPVPVLEDDSVDEVGLAWPGADEFRIEVPSVMNIGRSERGVLGLKVSYQIRKDVLEGIEAELNAPVDPDVSSGRSLDQDNKDHRAYIRGFREWSRRYATP